SSLRRPTTAQFNACSATHLRRSRGLPWCKRPWELGWDEHAGPLNMTEGAGGKWVGGKRACQTRRHLEAASSRRQGNTTANELLTKTKLSHSVPGSVQAGLQENQPMTLDRAVHFVLWRLIKSEGLFFPRQTRRVLCHSRGAVAWERRAGPWLLLKVGIGPGEGG
ncbi:hypothetical protein JZ751_017872, partial [Albula glossodonta]